MINDILSEAEDRMKKTIEHLTKDLATLRAGRDKTDILDLTLIHFYERTRPY